MNLIVAEVDLLIHKSQIYQQGTVEEAIQNIQACQDRIAKQLKISSGELKFSE